MSPRALVTVIGLCSAVLGCETRPFDSGRGKSDCSGQSCDVRVTVTCAGTACSTSVNLNTLHVEHGQSPKITWELTNSNYTFSSNGIVIANGGDEFSGCGPEANGRKFSCKDLHTKPGFYKYTVNVTGSPPVPPLDPFVDNQ